MSIKLTDERINQALKQAGLSLNNLRLPLIRWSERDKQAFFANLANPNPDKNAHHGFIEDLNKSLARMSKPVDEPPKSG